jgi:hypothetical protein
MPIKIKIEFTNISNESPYVGIMSPYPQVLRVVVTKYKLVTYYYVKLFYGIC